MRVDAYLKEKSALVNAALDEILPKEEGPASVLFSAMRYSVFAGGKRLRPSMFLAVCELLGKESSTYLPFACALEMIHTYSLIHDDLPAMDNDDLRRGKPTCHVQFGEDVAILAGDALLNYAFNAMLMLKGKVDAERLLAAMDEISYCAGTRGMIVGQIADLAAEGRKIDIEELRYIHRHKTGALFAGSLCSAAILLGAEEAQLAALREYAVQAGLAFQIADDILDVVGDEKTLGKPIGSDAKNEKATYVSLFGLDGARARGNEAVQKAQAALSCFGPEADLLRELAAYFMSRTD